jgi:glutamine synthetase
MSCLTALQKGQKSSDFCAVERPASTRLELRCPDPSCNPYLAFAVMLAAGLDGIERSLEPPPISNEDLYDLNGRAREARGL